MDPLLKESNIPDYQCIDTLHPEYNVSLQDLSNHKLLLKNFENSLPVPDTLQKSENSLTGKIKNVRSPCMNTNNGNTLLLNSENNSFCDNEINSSTEVNVVQCSKSKYKTKKKEPKVTKHKLELEDGIDIDLKLNDNPTWGLEEISDTHTQETRAELRERFLWAVTGLTGQHVKVEMLQDNLHVSGTLRGIDKDSLRVHLQDLNTPMGVHPWATLRLPDCIALEFPLNEESVT